MNKFYPAIFYPPLVLEFLVKNPASSFISYHSQAILKPGEVSTKQSISTLLAIKFSDFTTIICLFFVLIGFLIAVSFFLLSPGCLVMFIWVSVGFGCWSFISPISSQKLENKNMSNFQMPSAVTNEKILRLPQREAKLKQWIAGKILQPIGRSDAPTGVSEKAFYQVLKRVFPDVIQGIAFQNPQFSYPYSADFVLVHTSSLSIDIEIDEPYVGDTKAPHHCIDQGKDDMRNEFFTNGNWLVIRFSEKQAVKYPQSCCKFIAKVLEQVVGDKTFISKLESVADLPPDPMWTKAQAKKWAKNDYRKTYLPVYQNR